MCSSIGLPSTSTQLLPFDLWRNRLGSDGEWVMAFWVGRVQEDEDEEDENQTSTWTVGQLTKGFQRVQRISGGVQS